MRVQDTRDVTKRSSLTVIVAGRGPRHCVLAISSGAITPDRAVTAAAPGRGGPRERQAGVFRPESTSRAPDADRGQLDDLGVRSPGVRA